MPPLPCIGLSYHSYSSKPPWREWLAIYLHSGRSGPNYHPCDTSLKIHLLFSLKTFGKVLLFHLLTKAIKRSDFGGRQNALKKNAATAAARSFRSSSVLACCSNLFLSSASFLSWQNTNGIVATSIRKAPKSIYTVNELPRQGCGILFINTRDRWMTGAFFLERCQTRPREQ